MKELFNFSVIFAILAIVLSIFMGSSGVGAAFLISIYMFPAYLAQSRGHRNGDSIGTMNLFLGWTIIGWIACLIWAQNDFDESRSKDTPYDMFKRYLDGRDWSGGCGWSLFSSPLLEACHLVIRCNQGSFLGCVGGCFAHRLLTRFAQIACPDWGGADAHTLLTPFLPAKNPDGDWDSA